MGGVNCIQTFFGFLDFFIFTRSLTIALYRGTYNTKSFLDMLYFS